tara:strand:+ start:1004 stop:1552 length:549 start_codon:yes stop_codon:yes gene_type:complete
MITELKNPVTENYKNLKNLVLGNNFPWYYLDKTVYGTDKKDMSFFAHSLLGRPTHEIDGKKIPAIPESSSPYFHQCYFILKEILDYNNVDFEVMYRMNINMTPHSSIKESLPHIDLNLPHKVVIVYLNKFSKGRTVVLGKDKQKFYSNPKEDNVIIFDGKLTHFQESPNKDEKRIVMVANFQ